MQKIGERISFVDHPTKSTIIILPKTSPWALLLMGAWLGMWLCIGFVSFWALGTLSLSPKERIVLWVFMSFWCYYALRVGRSFIWMRWGEERILIDEIGLHLKRSVRRYGKRKVYYFENIKNLSFFIPEEGSIQSVWESSPWINGAERFSFDYFGKMIKFGNKLTQKEAQLLSQVIEKRMRKLAKK